MSNAANNIEQTVENTRFVFASTDMTAIYSFVVAAVIGLIIALIGCFLAWWYGKKSFDLTTQSFKITIEQIQASVDSAKENTALAIDSAKDSYERQLDLKKRELIFQSRQVWLNDLRNTSALYLSTVFKIEQAYSNFLIATKSNNETYYMKHLDIFIAESNNLEAYGYKIELLFKPGGDFENKILYLMGELKVVLAEKLKKMKLSANNEEKNNEDEKEIILCVEDFKIKMRTLLKKEWEKTKELK